MNARRDGGVTHIQPRAMSAGASDGSGCTRSRANAASLLAAPWLPAIAQPVGYRARRRASRKAWYLSTVACVAALCTAAAQAADQGTLIYVPNSEGNSVSIIDSASNTTIATIDSVGQIPSTVSVSSDQAHVYVASDTGVFAIDTATNVVTQWTAVNPGDPKPRSIAVTPDGRTIYVGFDNGIVPIGTQARTFGKSIPMDGSGRIVIAPDGETAYVASLLTGIVTPVDLAAGEAGTPINVGGDNHMVFGLAISPDGKTVYASGIQQSSTDSYIYAIDISTGDTKSTYLDKSEPYGLAVSQDGKILYVAQNALGLVRKFDTQTLSGVGDIGGGSSPTGVALAPDGKTLYVSYAGNTVRPIDLTTGTNGAGERADPFDIMVEVEHRAGIDRIGAGSGEDIVAAGRERSSRHRGRPGIGVKAGEPERAGTGLGEAAGRLERSYVGDRAGQRGEAGIDVDVGLAADQYRVGKAA